MKPIVIIGAGMPGYAVAGEFRKRGAAMPLLIITSGSGGVSHQEAAVRQRLLGELGSKRDTAALFA